jgi:hypothetical protein
MWIRFDMVAILPHCWRFVQRCDFDHDKAPRHRDRSEATR